MGLAQLYKIFIPLGWKLFYMVSLMGLINDSSVLKASDESFLRGSSSRIMWIITKPVIPSLSPYKPAEIRKTNRQIRFLSFYLLDDDSKYLLPRKAKKIFYGKDKTRFELPLNLRKNDQKIK